MEKKRGVRLNSIISLIEREFHFNKGLRVSLLLSFIFLTLVLFFVFIMPATSVSHSFSFVEDFTWIGNHGATIKAATATTVWWNENNWDVRSDTSWLNIANFGGREHQDIHRSVSGLRNGSQQNMYEVGGTGESGVAITHVEDSAIQSGRLRNPMLISATQPGVVEFYASNFVTNAEWWEIAITPADGTIIAADNTAVPGGADHFPGPPGDTGGNPGPGHFPAEDSINFIVMGSSNDPCAFGWFALVGIQSSINYVSTDQTSDLFSIDPGVDAVSEKLHLFNWRLEYYPNRIEAFVDFDEDGIIEHFDTYFINIPWSEVYVHLIGIAYESVSHPTGACNQGPVRELAWKDVRISPVKYARTAAYPKNEGTVQVPKRDGWTGYDTRDTQRHGPPVLGIPQPNEAAYDRTFSQAFCSGLRYGCGSPVSSKTLTFELPAADAVGITRAQLVYDIKCSTSL